MPKPLKVLHVYSGNLFGGVERMLISLAALDPSRSSPHFALCFEGKLSHTLQEAGSAVTFLGPVRLRNPLSALRARRKLARFLSANEFDAVVCHSIWVYCIFAPVVARGGHAPILFLHDIPEPEAALYRWAWRKPPALCIVNSKATAAPLERLRPHVPVSVVHPLVNPPEPTAPHAIAQQRTQWGAKQDEIVILLASRFDPLKGHRNLFQALGALREVPRWRCWIAGAPQRPHEEAYRRELEGLSASLGIGDRITFIGHRDDMDKTLAACDLYCQPNETPDAYGLVFIEAMYAGKPVVGRALGGALEIVTTECGILCPPGVSALSTALRRLLDDTDLRQRMSEAGPARAAALSGPEQFEAQFRAALEGVGIGGELRVYAAGAPK